MKSLSSKLSHFLKISLFVFLFAFYHQAAFAIGENMKGGDNEAKEKVKPACTKENQTDSLKAKSNYATVKEDSVKSTQKSKPQSGASFNILFQVIYKNSFSEIFDVNN